MFIYKQKYLKSAINILNRWFDNHIASMNEPLDISRVVKKYNLFNETDILISS
jgi:hypothetical protein